MILVNKETTPLSLVLFVDKSLLPLNSQSIARLPRTGCTFNTLTDYRTHNGFYTLLFSITRNGTHFFYGVSTLNYFCHVKNYSWFFKHEQIINHQHYNILNNILQLWNDICQNIHIFINKPQLSPTSTVSEWLVVSAQSAKLSFG